MINIIVDSTCDLPGELIKKHGIEVVPLRITLGEMEYRDKLDINADGVFAAMEKGIVPKTSQVCPEDFYRVFGRHRDGNNGFIYLAFSSAMSGTYGAAEMVLDEMKSGNAELRAEVIDSKAGSTAIGLMALQAARMAENGCPFEELTQRLREMADHCEHIFTIADLGWLVKGGRIGRLQGILGSLMNIKPLLEVKNGVMSVFGKARGIKNAANAVVDEFIKRSEQFPEQTVGINHSNDLQGALDLRDAITKRCGAKSFIINQIGGVLGSHLGIGGLGVFFFNRKFSFYEL